MPSTESLPNLPPSVARHTLYLLTESLPPPISDLPEERVARDQGAIAAVAALRPADAIEARLAARVVAADAHATDCLRLAGLPGRTAEEVRRCRAQASSMMRASDSALRTLRQMQAARAKAEPTVQPHAPAASDVAAEADEYALQHRKRATLIRRLGRLPERVQFGPMRPELVAAIATGTSAILCSLDQPGAPRLRMAA